MGSVTILCGDAAVKLREMEPDSVHCCVTSPPYWGLRDYGVDGQLGLEKTPEEYVAKMVEVFREVRRVLREDGTCWVNMGDSYISGGRKERDPGQSKIHPAYEGGAFADGLRPGTPVGLKPKDLVGIPWRLAFALQADGWWLRQDIIWHKPNPMPESVTDRCTKAHEYVFLLSKSDRYVYDAEAIKEQSSDPVGSENRYHSKFGGNKASILINDGLRTQPSGMRLFNGNRNRRSVWTIQSAPYKEAHFATFPPALVRPCILAGTSARGCCPKCGAPWWRVVEKQKGEPDSFNGSSFNRGKTLAAQQVLASVGTGERTIATTTTGWKPSCDCDAGALVPCTVLDPFAGSGTTGMVALELGRSAVIIELNPKYVELIHSRTNVTSGLAL